MSAGSQNECPLCMEPLELDDINFFPCACGYQVCRFCWHRIRTDENGLCPACRRSYTESPAEFKPLAGTDLQKLKKEKRQKESEKKQKAAENRNHLANVRVVQKNLVFVVGLSQRLADAEILKKQEYFGRFGKIFKIVINQSTTYAGFQGPSASAYVTYLRSEDAIHAIQAVNNIIVDGRTIKASLGTTKYCSYFLRGLSCTKSDCMYQHEIGDESASFTKEQMQQGKHLEYEQMLYDEYNQNTRTTSVASVPTSTSAAGSSVIGNTKSLTTKPSNLSLCSGQKKFASSVQHQNLRNSCHVKSSISQPTNNISGLLKPLSNSLEATVTLSEDQPLTSVNYCCADQQRTSPDDHLPADGKSASGMAEMTDSHMASSSVITPAGDANLTPSSPTISTIVSHAPKSQAVSVASPSSCSMQEDKLWLLHKQIFGNCQTVVGECRKEGDNCSNSADNSGQPSSFGAQANRTDCHEDDLEFDPWNESTKGLADMMEKENKFLDKDARLKHFDQSNHLTNCKVASWLGDGIGGISSVPHNKSVALKQLPIPNHNGRVFSAYFRPQNTSAMIPDYVAWQNNLRLMMKANTDCEFVPQNDKQMVDRNNIAPQKFYWNYSGVGEKGWNHQNSRPDDFLWRPSPAVPGSMTVQKCNSSLQPFSNDFERNGFQLGSRTQFGPPFGLVSNSRPEVHLGPPGFFALSSIHSHTESQSTLADSVD